MSIKLNPVFKDIANLSIEYPNIFKNYRITGAPAEARQKTASPINLNEAVNAINKALSNEIK